MSAIKLCFIGAGFHASTNIYPSVIAAGAEITAIATRNLERSQAALTRFGSRGTPYDDYKQMIGKEACDGVVVVAQPRDQLPIVLDCIAAGKNVYVDKPLGWNAEEARIAADAAERAGVVLMVGFMKRYAPVYSQVKGLIMEGTLGVARSFQARFAVDSTLFCKDEEQFLKLAAIHYVDLMRHMFGEVAQVTGISASTGEYVSQSLSLQFGNGVIGSVYFAGMTAWSREDEQLLITFEHGFVQTDGVSTLRVHRSRTDTKPAWQGLEERDNVMTPSVTPMSGGLKDLYLHGFVGEMEHFMNCCRSGNWPLSSGQDNVGTMDLCDRILEVLQGR